MILFKECDVFSPEPLGKKDVLVAGGKVVAIADQITEPAGVDVDVISAGGTAAGEDCLQGPFLNGRVGGV